MSRESQPAGCLFRISNVIELKSWHIERDIVDALVFETTGIPRELRSLIIAFGGSSHQDAMTRIGQCARICEFARGFESANTNVMQKKVNQLLECIACQARYVKHVHYLNLSKITVLTLKIHEFNDWLTSAAWPHVADIFYQILLLGWTLPALFPSGAEVAKIEVCKQ